jgi:tetratricopeptide (TPR) repeat protein
LLPWPAALTLGSKDQTITDSFQEAPLKTRSAIVIALALCAMLALPATAQQQPGMSVETSQSLFSVMAAINVCGYDADLSQSIPLRQQIREEVLKAAKSPEAQSALRNLCAFYEDHRQDTAAHTLSNYASLGLNMADAPTLELRTKESDLPPDAIYVLGFLPLLRHFNEAANLNAIWLRHRADYEQLVAKLHQPGSDTLVSTDLYLRRNLSGYVKHQFVVYVEPLAAPSEVNSRNYGDDYYVVISPGNTDAVRLDQIRHTYLHYILDAKALARATTLERLSPLLESVKAAPLEESYRFDMGLLMTESLIKAIEARLLGGRKGPSKAKEQLAWDSTRQGFILTNYFYAKLVAFEGDEVGFDQSYADWLHDINVEEQLKFAATVPFLKSGTPELVRKSQHREMLVDLAERALASGNFEGAQSYAQQVIQKQIMQTQDDTGRALFVLARVAVAGGELSDAQSYFERAASASSDLKIRGWSHVYLGRILDMQEHRQEAVEHYRAALDAGGPPELKAAAEKGLRQAYQTPVKRPID